MIATSWLAVSAGADTLKEQAKKAVVAGLEAQSAGRYDEAIAYYRKAYDAVPHAEILFNLAQAYRLKGDAETALGLYQRYLLVEPRGRVAADARKWVAALERVVAERKTDAKTDAAKTDIAKTSPAKPDPTKPDAAKTDIAKTSPAKPDPT
ncbi:MAG TPA: tetratricopeptide repeat protein, partial [Kofleriaceae bacterium]